MKNCDQCGNEIPNDGERTIGLSSLRTSYTFTVCQPCDERIRNACRVNTLGRNEGLRELRDMAERLPERERSIEEMLTRKEPQQRWGTPEVDEGANVGEWLKQNGVPDTVRGRRHHRGRRWGRNAGPLPDGILPRAPAQQPPHHRGPQGRAPGAARQHGRPPATMPGVRR